MPREFKLPDLGEGIHEAQVVNVKIKAGDTVTQDQMVMEVETDKAAVELPVPYAGVVTKLNVQIGDTITVGQVLLEVDDGTAEPAARAAVAVQVAGGGDAFDVAVGQPAAAPLPDYGPGPVPASPAVRRLARELGIELRKVHGTGPGSRIVREDVERYQLTRTARPAAPSGMMPTPSGVVPTPPSASAGEAGPRPPTAPVQPVPRAAPTAPSGVAPTPSGVVPTSSGVMPTPSDVAPTPSDVAPTPSSASAGVGPRSPTAPAAERPPAHVARTAAAPAASPAPPAAVAAVSPAAEPLPDFAQWGPVRREKIPQIRKTIARQMARAWALIPHVTHVDEADVTDLEIFRKEQGKAFAPQGAKLTLTAFILKATAGALREFPKFNASYDEPAAEVIFKDYVNIGVAVDSPRGLMVPVIRDVDRKGLVTISKELREIADRAREFKLDVAEMRGGTFTITNVGALGGLFATPMINWPEVAILGLGRLAEKPVVRNGQVVVRKMLPLFISFDHRVIDGADGARFINRIAVFLENPLNLLLVS